MSGPLHVEVRVRGRLGGDLLALVDDLDPRTVPRHTVLTVGCADDGAAWDTGGVAAAAGSLTRLLDALERAGVGVDRVLPCPRAGTGVDGPATG